jgi:hypothetical protein
MVPLVATEKNPQWHHRESIPRPSDYKRSALTTTLPHVPKDIVKMVIYFNPNKQLFLGDKLVDIILIMKTKQELIT